MPGAVVSLSTQNIKSVWAISAQLARTILGCVCVCGLSVMSAAVGLVLHINLTGAKRFPKEILVQISLPQCEL